MHLAEYLQNLDRCLTVPELARLLNIHKITLYRMAQSGRLPSFRVGAAVRINPRAAAAWLRERGVL